MLEGHICTSLTTNLNPSYSKPKPTLKRPADLRATLFQWLRSAWGRPRPRLQAWFVALVGRPVHCAAALEYFKGPPELQWFSCTSSTYICIHRHRYIGICILYMYKHASVYVHTSMYVYRYVCIHLTYIYIYIMWGLRGESKIKVVKGKVMSGDMPLWELVEVWGRASPASKWCVSQKRTAKAVADWIGHAASTIEPPKAARNLGQIAFRGLKTWLFFRIVWADGMSTCASPLLRGAALARMLGQRCGIHSTFSGDVGTFLKLRGEDLAHSKTEAREGWEILHYTTPKYTTAVAEESPKIPDTSGTLQGPFGKSWRTFGNPSETLLCFLSTIFPNVSRTFGSHICPTTATNGRREAHILASHLSRHVSHW